MKKKKGFTLIELLAVIVILAIITLIATPFVLRLINKTKEGALNAIKTSMVEAAKLYTMTNDGYFNMKSGEKEYIQLGQLENGYLEKVHNPYGEESCDGYVKVENNNDKIEYTAYLDCGDGNTLLVDSAYVNYGGKYLDEFTNGIKTSDGGYIVIGQSNSPSYSNLTSKNPNTIDYDGIIVKYNAEGIEEWSNNFGGSGHDNFNDVIEIEDGYLAFMSSTSTDGDLAFLQSSRLRLNIVVHYNKQGKEIKKIALPATEDLAIMKALKTQNGYYVAGEGTTPGDYLQHVIQYDQNWNVLWQKTYNNNSASNFYNMIQNQKGNILIVGRSSSTNDVMEGIKISPINVHDAVIFEIEESTKKVVGRAVFGGLGHDEFIDVVEVDDGYIVVGEEYSTEKGQNIYIVKYGKTADSNNVYPLLWNQTFGGSKDDYATSIITKESSVLIGINSFSHDQDMENRVIDKNSQYAYILEYDIATGNLISKKEIESNNTDRINKIIKDTNGYTLIGNSFSTGGVFEPFNYGNSDAFLMKVDNNLNPIKEFKLKTSVKSKPKEIVKNYGTTIPTVEGKETLKLYTTNDPTTELGKWCTSYTEIDPNSNYKYADCLIPFNSSNNIILNYQSVVPNNVVPIQPSHNNNWIHLKWYCGNVADITLSNLKVQFEGSQSMSIEQAVNEGYLEPLVLIGRVNIPNVFFENSYNLLSGGSTGLGHNPSLNIFMRPKKTKMTTIMFESTDSSTDLPQSKAEVTITELIDFDISLSKSE